MSEEDFIQMPADAQVMTWRRFVEAGRAFFDANKGCPMYRLIESLDDLYHAAYGSAPFPRTGPEKDNLLHASFLICHRALLSAATAIASGQPEDAPAITRRALEAAKTCLVVKADPSNLEEWKNVERRVSRWESRLKSEKPKTFTPAYKNTSAEPLYEELQSAIAALSDFAVHFTPEHVQSYQWGQAFRPDGATDTSFGVDEDRVPKEFLMLAGAHRLIFHVFDRCLDGVLLDCPQVRQGAELTLNMYNDLVVREGLADHPSVERW